MTVFVSIPPDVVSGDPGTTTPPQQAGDPGLPPSPFDPLQLTGANDLAQNDLSIIRALQQQAFDLQQASLMAQQSLSDGGITAGGTQAPTTSGGTGGQQQGVIINLQGHLFNVPDTGAANTDFTIEHNEGLQFVFYVLVKTSVAGTLYDGTIATTPTSITLRFSAANANIWLVLQ